MSPCVNLSCPRLSNKTSFYNTTVCIALLPDKSAKILVNAVVLIVMILALSGNFMVCYIVYRRPAMRSGINLLLANLAMSDFCTSLICTPLLVAVLNIQKCECPLGDVVCQLSAVLYISFQTEKGIILVVISIDRYFIIVKRKDTLGTQKAKIISGTSWILAIATAVPPLIGWGKYVYIPGHLQCMLKLKNRTKAEFSYVIFTFVFTGMLPLFIMCVSYCLILRTVRRNCFRVQNHPPVNPTAMHRKGKMFIDWSYKTRTFTTILILSLIFTICTFPFKSAELWMAVHDQHLSSATIIGLLCFSYMHIALNPIVYSIRIKKFREACMDILPRTIVTLPTCIPPKSRRRIRPHILYQVDKSSTVTTASVI